ncbi:MAG: hypothetical protein JSS82_08240 [Bacteroidetes bacterium]|nr:hypothetical protein [Bacteroidota bacterium]
MKKLSTLALIALAMIATSCNKKKDWTCTCTVNGSEAVVTLYDQTKKDAKAECSAKESNTQYTITGCKVN